MVFNPLDMMRKTRSDLSNFLIHLTKNGSIEEWVEMDFYKNHFLYKQEAHTVIAEDSLRKILTSTQPILKACSPFGVFKTIGINVGTKKKLGIHPNSLKSVCFSETPLRELPSFYKATQDPKNWNIKTNKYQKFGIGFSTNFIRTKRGNPVFYYDRRNQDIQQSIESLADSNNLPTTHRILYLCEPYGPKILEPQKEVDFRWEREWRINGDLTFNFDEVAFGICPEVKIPEYEKLVKKAFPFIDPDWNINKLKNALESRGYKTLADKI
jgi:hypothetical protein